MYTSERKSNRYIKTAISWFYVVLTLILFGAVYEYFSYGVYSYFMIYAFTFPFIGEVLPNLFLAHSVKELRISLASQNLWGAGIITLTTGSIFKGVLDIYGTTNRLTSVYWIAGIILMVIGLITGIVCSLINDRKKASNM